MKINSYLSFSLLLLLVSYTLAVQTSQQETAGTQEAKGFADVDVDANGGGGQGGGGGNWGGGGCRHGCCYSGYRGCQRCCSSQEEAKAVAEQAKAAADVDKQAYGGGGGNGGGGGGNRGGGGNWGGGGGGGGGCRFGCCGRQGYGGCQRCCSSLEEAKAFVGKKLNP